MIIMGGKNLDQFNSRRQAKPKDPTGTTPKHGSNTDKTNNQVNQ